MLGEDIRGINMSGDMNESHDAGGNSFPYAVEGESIMSFMKLRVGLGPTIDNGFIVSKQKTGALDGNAKVP